MEFWVINISKKNVCLSDLNLTIPAGRYYNLLDKKHFSYSVDRLEKSKKTGSLCKKNGLIKVSYEEPNFPGNPRKHKANQPMQMRRKAPAKVDMPQYEEIVFSDEKYAEEMSELFKEKLE